MAVLDWEVEEHTYEEILFHFLDGGTNSKYTFEKEIDKNELEKAIYGMIDTVSSEESNIMNLEELDKIGVTGDLLIKLWELCKCNSEYFRKTIGYITGTFLSKAFTSEEVLANLSLDEPFEFIPNDHRLDSFQTLSLRMNRGELPVNEYESIIFGLRNSLVKRYNRYVESHPEEEKNVLPEITSNKETHEKVL